MKLLILNGPNLNLLGLREPEIYGSATYHDLLALIQSTAQTLGLEATVYQSNHEGDLIDQIQAARGVYDGIVFNPAAYTHTSVALLDASWPSAFPPWRSTSPTSASGKPSAKFPTSARLALQRLQAWGYADISEGWNSCGAIFYALGIHHNGRLRISPAVCHRLLSNRIP